MKMLFEFDQIWTTWLLGGFLPWGGTYTGSKQGENAVETRSQSKIQDQQYVGAGGEITPSWSPRNYPFSLLIKQSASALRSVPCSLCPCSLGFCCSFEGSPHLFLHPRVFKITSVYSPSRKFPNTWLQTSSFFQALK